MRLKALFFDMDGTLVHLPADFTPARFLLSVYRKLGLEAELENVEQAYEEVENWWTENSWDYTQWTREKLVEFNRRVLLRLGCRLSGEKLNQLAEKVQHHWDRFPDEAGEILYSDVFPALKRLEAHGLVLGIVSHRTLAAIHCSLRRHGLAHHFQVLVSPQVAAAPRGKLDLAMWEYALREARVAPVEAAHLGDQYEYDVVGARATGLLPVLVDRDDLYAEPDCWKAKDLLEALRLLGL